MLSAYPFYGSSEALPQGTTGEESKLRPSKVICMSIHASDDEKGALVGDLFSEVVNEMHFHRDIFYIWQWTGVTSLSRQKIENNVSQTLWSSCQLFVHFALSTMLCIMDTVPHRWNWPGRGPERQLHQPHVHILVIVCTSAQTSDTTGIPAFETFYFRHPEFQNRSNPLGGEEGSEEGRRVA